MLTEAQPDEPVFHKTVECTAANDLESKIRYQLLGEVSERSWIPYQQHKK